MVGASLGLLSLGSSRTIISRLIGLITDGYPILNVLVSSSRSCILYFRVFVGAGRGTARGTSTFAYMTD